MTTRRLGSSPKLSVRTPSMVATASWTIFRSAGLIGSDQRLEVCALEVDVASDLVDPCRDIAIDVQRVEESFEEVTCPLGILLHHLRCDVLVSFSIGAARGSGSASSRSFGWGGRGTRVLTILRT